MRFGKQSENLRESFVKTISRHTDSIVRGRALKAKRLIALNKLPGVRPIGIGESLIDSVRK